MENTDYYSLTGYLSLKSIGALSWLVSTRRYWCALNETVSSLDFFNSERDLIKERKKPIERIALLRSAFTLSHNEDGVFIILTNGKEYHLQAENHEALMVWLIGLQTKRDLTRRSQSISDVSSPSNVTLDELKPIERKRSILLCDSCINSLCDQCRKESPKNRTPSSSSSITSIDSAFTDQQRSQQTNYLQETLTTLKCELDGLLNREGIYQTIIKEKSESIRQLESHLSALGSEPASITKNQKIKKIFDERCRTTNNELKFLHSEIVKLSRVIREDELKIDQLSTLSRSQELQRERLQRDYLSLLQSILCTDEGRLIGGAKHRQRLKQMLEECRQRDPSLPSFESLEQSGLYVDSYGFKHEKIDEHERMQYICMKLIHFYDSKTSPVDDQLWRTLVTGYRTNAPTFVKKTLKQYLRQGLPNHLRAEFWRLTIEKNVAEIRQSKHPHYYQHLCDLLAKSDINSKFEKQIALDLNRTMPNNLRFTSKDSEGIRQLRQVLHAFCLHNPQIGYCQGMNFIVAIALLFLEPEDAFWLLVLVSECYLTNYYNRNLIGAQVDQFVLKELLRQKAPDLHGHFERAGIDLTSITLNWFLAIFIDSVPFECLLRIWDCFLFEGVKVLFRLALAILILNRDNLLIRDEPINIIRYLKETTKYCLDIDQLFKIAFEDLKPFCPRRDLAVKQAYWTKILMEKVRRQKSVDDEDSKTMQLDCAVQLPRNRLWLAFGSQFTMSLYQVDIEQGQMIDLNVHYPSRVFTMHCVQDDLVLMGTLAGYLLAWAIDEKQCRWSLPLNSCLHSLISVSKTNFEQIYCGLANGTLAVVQLYKDEEPKETFCLSLESSPIINLHLCQDQLWCLTSRKVLILSEKTLDVLSYIYLTDCCLDTPSPLSCQANGYIWILIRSTSNILQAWHPISHQLHASICLNQIFDRLGKSKEQLAMMNRSNDLPDDEASFYINDISISSFFISDEHLWIGTSMGILYVFDYTFQSKSFDFTRLISLSSDRINHHYEEKSRSQSDSAVCSTEHESIGETLFRHHSTSTLTSLESCSTSPSSLPANGSDDDESSGMKFHLIKAIESSTIENLLLTLNFKAKIADTPVKYLCQTDLLPLVISCSGRLGDDEMVCRWHRITKTNQWTNDVIVEFCSQTMVPIRPRYARQEYLKSWKIRASS